MLLEWEKASKTILFRVLVKEKWERWI